MVFLFRLFEDVVEEICFDNNSATGRMDKDAPLGKLGVGGALTELVKLLFDDVEGTTF